MIHYIKPLLINTTIHYIYVHQAFALINGASMIKISVENFRDMLAVIHNSIQQIY